MFNIKENIDAPHYRAFVKENSLLTGGSPHEGPVMQKVNPLYDVFMGYKSSNILQLDELTARRHLWPLLLTWFNFNPSMDK